MENENKYRRWAWGALIGLAAVIIVAGFIMVVSSTSPKPNTAKTNNVATKDQKDEKTTENQTGDDQTKKDDQKTEEKPETTKDTTQGTPSEKQNDSMEDELKNTPKSTSSIPKTGPEDAILPIMALAVSGYLIAMNVAMFKKNA
jgi:Sec-independent protein translocase protein TatA